VPSTSWVCIWENVFSRCLAMELVEQGTGAGAGLRAAIAAQDTEEGRKHTVPIGLEK